MPQCKIYFTSLNIFKFYRSHFAQSGLFQGIWHQIYHDLQYPCEAILHATHNISIQPPTWQWTGIMSRNSVKRSLCQWVCSNKKAGVRPGLKSRGPLFWLLNWFLCCPTITIISMLENYSRQYSQGTVISEQLYRVKRLSLALKKVGTSKSAFRSDHQSQWANHQGDDQMYPQFVSCASRPDPRCC